MGSLILSVYIVLGNDLLEDETFVAKVFNSEEAALGWADAQNAKQPNICYSVHERWVEDGDEVEFVSE